MHDTAHAVTVIPDTIAARYVASARLAIDQVHSSLDAGDAMPESIAARLLAIAITLDDAVYMSGVNGGGPRTVTELRAALQIVIEALSAH